ncbi:unnamed protein product [Chrysodeixis includens]|uniref:C2H2-type domain-containing protein n=1 Tax=Chrysodeixis includens TaxID=689277 RepID=A0A9P0FVH8_CHRIL|nr:unnamed protein product [Chrysodeixis includens]
MDKCGICLKPAVQLFETGKDGIYACFKCQPLVPEVMIGDNGSDQTVPQTSSNNEESFQKNMQLQNHLRNHRAERRFVCTYCNKAFSQSNNLRAHLRIHTNERPFKCSECGKAFTQVTNLNNHVRLHTGERPFVCPEPGCNKAYAQVTNLNQHRKRHLNGGPVEATYDCTVCGEQFQQRNHMYMHRREAHGEARGARTGRRCRACAAAFPSDKLLQRHLALQHPDLQHNEHQEPQHASANEYICVFSSCGKRLSSAREHTEHLLREHQLRVLSHRQHAPRRGRPPKMLKDPLEIKEEEFHEVKITKQQPQYLPKLKVQSLFQ